MIIRYRIKHFDKLILFLYLTGTSTVPATDWSLNADEFIAYFGPSNEWEDGVFKIFMDEYLKKTTGKCHKTPIQYIQANVEIEESVEPSVLNGLTRRPALAVTPNAISTLAAKKSSTQTPIVFYSNSDPVEYKIVADMRTRTEPITGVSYADHLHAKRLEILKEFFPDIRTVGVIGDKDWLVSQEGRLEILEAAHTAGLRLNLLELNGPNDLPDVQKSIISKRADAWYIPPSYTNHILAEPLIQIFRSNHVPVIHSIWTHVEMGALMAYSAEAGFVIPALAELAARICSGEHGGSIPIETPRRAKLFVNSRYDTENLKIPSQALLRAEVVIYDREK